MKAVTTLRLRAGILVFATIFSAASSAAPGDPLGSAHRVGTGGVLDHDPFFEDFNQGRGAITLNNGNVVVAWRARDAATSAPIPVPNSPDGADGRLDGSFFRVYNSGGTPVSAVTAPYLDINSTGAGNQNTPIMAPLSGGGFVIAWNSAQGPGDTPAADPFGGDAYGRVYDATGTPVSGTFKINENDPRGVEDTQEPLAVVGLTGGGFAIVWTDGNDAAGAGTNTDDFFLRVYNAAGMPQAGSARLGGVAQDLFFKDFDAFQSVNNLAALTNGNVVVGWGVRDTANDGTGTSVDGAGGAFAAFVQVFGPTGAAVSGEIRPYLDINPDGSGSQLSPLVAALGGGGFAVTWNSNNNTNDAGNSDVGAGSNSTSGGDAYTRAYNGSGVAAGGTLRVNENRNDFNQEPQMIVGLTGGGYAVAWVAGEDGGVNQDDYYVRAFTAAGASTGTGSQPIGGALGFDPLFEDFNRSAGLIALSDGAFAAGISIRDSANNGTGTSVDGGAFASVLRVFESTGAARTAAIIPYLDVNPNGSGSQLQPRLAQVTGGFAVTWNSNHNTDDGANSDVDSGSTGTFGGDAWTRIYNNAGTALRATARVHATEPTGTNDEQLPVAILRSGANYTVVFNDNNNATSNRDDLFVRAFGDTPSAPEIAVEQPAATNIADGGSQGFGNVNVGSNTTLTFTIRNTGNANLTGLTTTLGGTNPGDFSVIAPTAPVAAAGSTTFQVRFTPGASGARSATLQIASNDADENPFDITLSGTGISLPNLTINDVTLTEANTGTQTATFTVSLSAPAGAGGVTFDIGTAANTATAASDYVTNTLTGQTIPAGSSTYTFNVTVNNDFVDEANESFFVNVTNAVGATVTDGQGVGTINDNDTAGITVNPTTGLSVTEAGSTATYTVVLASQPTGNVAIGVTSSDTSEGTVAPATLTFTSANWNVAQTVTVTGVNDALDDGDIAYSLVNAAPTSTDANYSAINPADVGVTTVDDDAAGVTVAPTSGLSVTEAGSTATFTVVLTSQPVANVSIGLTSNDTGEATVAPGSLTFTGANWNVAQTVTVTGVNDALDDGNQSWSIVTGNATSTDPGYSARVVADVTGSTVDDDAVGINVAPVAGLATTEAGGTATFTVVLASQPTATVTVGLSSSAPAEAAVAPGSLNFDGANWNTPQTVTVTGVDDNVDDGNIAFTIVTAAATSADAGYNGLNASDVTGSNTDNDTAAIVVAPTSGLATTEAGGTATFTVVLGSQPTANVTVGVTSSAPAEATVGPASLLFTAANWNTPQTVTVTGADDSVDDGDIAFTIVTAAATSADANYGGFNAADVTGSNADNDAAAIVVAPLVGLSTTEAGGSASFTVVLASQPTAGVSVALSSSDVTEGTVAPAAVSFTAANWNVPQTVTVTGINDAVDDGDIAYSVITAPATSGDAGYSGIDAGDVLLSNTDDDGAGILVTPTAGLSTTEAGGSATFSVVLTSQPTANVTIAVSSSDASEGTAAPGTLTFTAANWNVAQTVTVTGVDDALDDGDIAYSVLTAAATSADANYSGANAADVMLGNIDNDAAGIAVAPVAGLVTSEGGVSATFTVVLASQPTADVTVPLSSNDTTEGTVAPAALVFTAANWNVAQTATVTGVNDAVDDGDVAYGIVTGAATSADAGYAGIDAANVAASNTDDDGAGITVTPTTGLVTTEGGGVATFTVVLASQPTANVSIGVTSSNTTEGTVAPPMLAFTAVNWNVPQTVTVTGVNDALADGSIAYNVITAAATSADPVYQGVDAADVGVTNADNDSSGITVSPLTGLVTTEAGGTATFTVVLNSQPSADVTVSMTSSDTTEGTLGTASLVFTAANWNQARSVIVTGVDDLQFDGNIAYSVSLGNAASTDPQYNNVPVGNVALTNNDNDVDRFTASTATGSGIGTVVIAGGNCSIDMAQSAFIGVGGLQIPPATGFPHGAVRLRAQGCTPGASITLTLTLPSRPDGSLLMGLSPTLPAVVRTTATAIANGFQFTLVDGGALDGDGVANGVIVDVFGVAQVAQGSNPGRVMIPAGGDASRLILLALMALLGALALRRRV